MDKEAFIKFLRGWLEGINTYNAGCAEGDRLILDKRYFDLSSDRKYSIKCGCAETMLEADYCLVGDNPGKNEKEHGEYFYYDADNPDGRRAGTKANKLIGNQDLSKKSFIYFNKCLTSTNRTKDLKPEKIEVTSKYVIDFINNLGAFNDKLKFCFLGVNKKFKEVFNEIKLKENNALLYYHFCSSKYCEKELLEILTGNDNKTLNFEDYDFIIIQRSDDDSGDDGDANGGDDGPLTSPVLN